MHKYYQKGFTIIEVMLFLAITGLMFATMIGSVTVALNNQRYNDSVRSFQSLLQEQYSRLLNIENDGTINICGDENRGRGDCYLVGRLMVVNDSEVSSRQLVATNINEHQVVTNDVTAISGMTFRALDDVESQNIEWGSRIAWPSTHEGEENSGARSPRTVSIMLVRSPFTGKVYTFHTNGQVLTGSSDLAGMVTEENMSKSLALCMDSDGLLTINDRFIYIGPQASSAASVESLTNDSNRSNTKC